MNSVKTADFHLQASSTLTAKGFCRPRIDNLYIWMLLFNYVNTKEANLLPPFQEEAEN